jgi:hypothetical protein
MTSVYASPRNCVRYSVVETAFEIWWHTRRNQISSFDETDESISIGRGVSSVDYWQASCAHRPAGFVLLVQACVLQSCDAYWLPTPFSCFPLTSPPVRRRVPSHIKRTLPVTFSLLYTSVTTQNTIVDDIRVRLCDKMFCPSPTARRCGLVRYASSLLLLKRISLIRRFFSRLNCLLTVFVN